MPIALTICSANYLPFAKSLGDSIIRHNPGFKFIIVLVDEHRDFDRSFFQPHKIVYIADMQVPVLEEMNNRYDIFELSCALKPFVMEYMLKHEEHADIVYYFDSDILVFNSLEESNRLLQSFPLVLTPHIYSPIADDSLFPNEEVMLRAGIYNAGFFGVSKRPEIFPFLDWWKSRLRFKSFNDAVHGLFVDQLWLNYAPVFLAGTAIIRNPGYNVAYWNLHERTISEKAGEYNVNNTYPLVFFHYSGYDFNMPEVISKHQDRYTFETNKETLPLYDEYRSDALKNDYDKFISMKPAYGITKQAPLPPMKKKSFIEKIFSSILNNK